MIEKITNRGFYENGTFFECKSIDKYFFSFVDIAKNFDRATGFFCDFVEMQNFDIRKGYVIINDTKSRFLSFLIFGDIENFKNALQNIYDRLKNQKQYENKKETVNQIDRRIVRIIYQQTFFFIQNDILLDTEKPIFKDFINKYRYLINSENENEKNELSECSSEVVNDLKAYWRRFYANKKAIWKHKKTNFFQKIFLNKAYLLRKKTHNFFDFFANFQKKMGNF